jgi:hypothetical protein
LSNNAYTGHSFERENLPSLKLVAYADGIALGMSFFEDFQIFHQAYQDYYQAPNVKLNYHKTIAFPLNGKISQDWSSHLSSYGITHWFFDCPRTQIIWKSIWQHVFNYPVISFTPLKTYVYTLQPMNYVSAKKPLLSSLDTSQVVGYTLRGLWHTGNGPFRNRNNHLNTSLPSERKRSRARLIHLIPSLLSESCDLFYSISILLIII